MIRCCFYRAGGYLFERDLPVPPVIGDSIAIDGSLHVVRDRVWVLPTSLSGSELKINIDVDWKNPSMIPTF